MPSANEENRIKTFVGGKVRHPSRQKRQRRRGTRVLLGHAQHDGAASSNAIADLANALRQALQMTNEGGPTGHTGTYASRPIEIRQKVEMLAWTGKLESGQSVASAFRVFRGSVLSWVSAEGLMDVLKGESIPVGIPDVDLSRLRSYLGEERVAKSLKLWSQLIAIITAQPVQEMIFATGSPQEAWRVFESHYAVKSEERV